MIEPVHGIIALTYKGKRLKLSSRSQEVAIAALNDIKLTKLCEDICMTEEAVRQHLARIRTELAHHDNGVGAKTSLVCRDGIVRFEVG